MPAPDPKVRQAVISFLERQRLDFEEREQQHGCQFQVRTGAHAATVNVYNTGKIVVGGKDGPLKQLLEQMEAAIEAGEVVHGQVLPFEIEKFPDTIRERVPDCDPVVVRFIEEAILAVRANALLSAAFMIGAASERAINTLIYAYAECIGDETNRNRFLSRINNRMISVKYDEFTKSFKSCKTRPKEGILAHDIDVIIGGMFQFSRITRNEIGHPQIVPDLDRGVILANLGQFVTYIERIHLLMNHFYEHGVEL